MEKKECKKKSRVMDLYWKIEKDLNQSLLESLDNLEQAIQKKRLAQEKVKN